jgi:hypothetical protein
VTEKPATKYLRRDDAAHYVRTRHGLSCTAGYLAKLACQGGGPCFQRLDARVPVYTPEDLDDWAASRLSGPSQRQRGAGPNREDAA